MEGKKDFERKNLIRAEPVSNDAPHLLISSICTAAESSAAIAASIVYYDPKASEIESK